MTYAYDAAHLKTVSRYDSSGKCLYAHLYQEYDLSHHLLFQKLIGDLGVVTFIINPLGQRESINSRFYSQRVTYDSVGNVHALATPSGTSTYTYDPLYQLTEESGPLSHTYLYDSHFNRLEKDGQQSNLNALNQLANAEYDPNGNLLRSGDISYTYDALDRLISMKTPDLQFFFTYDSFHRRLSKTVYVETDTVCNILNRQFYFYDGLNEIGAVELSWEI